MSQVLWDAVGERFMEAGVDQGVLYAQGKPGVAWNGLISVLDKSVSDAPLSYYFDGVKYLIAPSTSEFEATISAYTYPPEFEECEGSQNIAVGILATQQEPVPFGMCYRTKIGNDLEGMDYGYKLHLVYNALASPSDRSNTTDTQTISPNALTWEIKTMPELIPGFAPSGHLVINSTEVDAFSLNALESVLYGYTSDPRLPLPSEVVDILWPERQVIVIASPSVGLVPGYAIPGDIIFSISDEAVYSFNGPPSDKVRDVIVIQGNSISLLPDTVIPNDIVYDETTGILYQYTS